LAVVESSTPGAEPFATVDAQLLQHGLGSILDMLRTATDVLVLRSDRDAARDGAIALLRSADDAMLALACAEGTPPAVAALLVQVRDDLGGSILAAVLLTETTKNPSNVAAQMLRRAAAVALERLCNTNGEPLLT
jgi:hypothetical protein